MRVEQIRGGVVEAVHEVHVAVVDSTGGLVARTGDPELVPFWRSAATPFQALPLLEDGAAARFVLTSEELALACASHFFLNDTATTEIYPFRRSTSSKKFQWSQHDQQLRDAMAQNRQAK